jgi:hypothetical protein
VHPISDFELQRVQVKEERDFHERAVLPGFKFVDDFISA